MDLLGFSVEWTHQSHLFGAQRDAAVSVAADFGARFIRALAGTVALGHKFELVDLTGDKAQNGLIVSDRFYI